MARCEECGKIRYLSKNAAKRAAKRMRGRRGALNAYRCGEFWHLGHLPEAVKRGAIPRWDIRGSG